MQTTIEKFEHPQLGAIRCKMDESGEPWFVGIDVATALGYKNTRDAITRHIEDEDKTTVGIHDGGSNYKTQAILINESGLYSLILSSKLESARQFKHWVTSDVLPTLRKHGMYASTSTLEQMIEDPQFGMELLKTLKEERDKRLYAEAQQMYLENKVEEMEPKYDYCLTILQSPNTVTVTQIAQDYGFSAIRFNELLRDLDIQYRQNEQWILYAKYKLGGYVQSNTSTYTRHDGTTGSKMYSRWTQKGRLFLYEKLKAIGILPLCESLSPGQMATLSPSATLGERDE